MSNDWDGIERRTTAALDQFKTLLSAHTEDEMDRYDQIINKINANDTKSEQRHDETQSRLNHLSQSIENFLAEQELFHAAIKRAFPKNEEGHPDYEGHRGAHLAWINDAKDAKELKILIRNTVLGAAAVAVVSFVTIAVWVAVLKGPTV